MAKYNSIDTIPAKVFFSILKDKDFQQLKPKPKEKGLEQIFVAIYDEFFIKSDNPESKRYLEVTKEIATLKYKIASLKLSLHFYWNNKTTKEMRHDFIDALKIGYNIEIDKDVPFIDEVQRVLTIEVGGLENDLIFAESEFEGMVKKSKTKDFDYYDQIGALSNVLKSNALLKEEMTLAVYVTLEKLAHKIVEQEKQNKK